MTTITLFTSGSTKEPKEIAHSWEYIKQCALRTIREVGLTNDDIVLDVFPGNTIAHYTITAMPAMWSGATLITANFDPYNYIRLFNQHQPTYISLIPRHYEILKNLKDWKTVNMSCVRYMVVGSGICTQEMIDDFKSKGVQTVANWYGMTEMPPPVFIGHNSEAFDFTPTEGYAIEFAADGECIVNGFHTGDIFDVVNNTFLRRKEIPSEKTWKNNF